MGTTLHGIIEWENGRGGWESIAKVEFNKNYEFMRLLHEYAPKLWPEDIGHFARYKQDRGTDTGLCWCDLGRLKSILSCKPEYAEDLSVNRHQPKAVVAFMASLEEDCGSESVRILFYEL